MSAQPNFQIETSFIRSWIEMGDCNIVVNISAGKKMRELEIDLVDINYVLRVGRVVESDMDESRGLWKVLGKTLDGQTLELSVAVISSECSVELLRILKVSRG